MKMLTAGTIAHLIIEATLRARAAEQTVVVTGYDEAAKVDPDAWDKLMKQDYAAIEARVAAYVGCPERTDGRARRGKGDRKRNKRDRWA